jgi:hypothetical protein
MERINRCIVSVLILIVGLQLIACTSPDTIQKEEPARVEPIEDTELSRIELTQEAAERIGVQTVPVMEERVVRKRAFGGRVVDAGASVTVRVALNASDLKRVDRSQPAIVRSLEEVAGGWMGQVVEAPDPEEATKALYFLVEASQSGFVANQAVLVEISMLSSGTEQKVIPYAAVLYDLQGETWVYTRPEPLVYVRAPVIVDYIDGDVAVLSEGPPAGTQVVTAGASELFGAESGIGGGGH